MHILIPTRNNPVALAGLLSSLLTLTRSDMTALDGCKLRLTLVDGSNDPAISDPHLSRLLTRFNLNYMHFLDPHVNKQRIAGLRAIAALDHFQDDTVLVVDDDHILLTDPRPVAEAFAREKDANAYFGICPDIINDKGYPDFALVTPDGGHHSLGRRWVNEEPMAWVSSDLGHYSANPGFLMTRARLALPMLEKMHAAFRDTPAVADDGWAKLLCGTRPMLHNGLQALHVGNKNRWWNQWGIKHTAVSLAVRSVENGK